MQLPCDCIHEKVLVFRDESPKIPMAEPFATLVWPQLRLSNEHMATDDGGAPQIENSPAQISGTREMAGLSARFERDPLISAGAILGNNIILPPEELKPPTGSSGRVPARAEDLQIFRGVLALGFANGEGDR